MDAAERKRKADRERIAAKRAAARISRDSEASHEGRMPVAADHGAPPGADPEWHPLIRDLYAAIGRSGQSAFYEPSDYGMLRIGCEIMSQQLLSAKPSAVMFASWDALMARLLVTEGDRRRMRLELERGEAADPDEDAAVAIMAAYRDKRAVR